MLIRISGKKTSHVHNQQLKKVLSPAELVAKTLKDNYKPKQDPALVELIKRYKKPRT